MIRCSSIAFSLLLAGCAGSPPNRYYTLSVESPCPAVSAPTYTGRRDLTIRLPALLDRPQLVVRTGPQTVDIREFDRWAEPLDQMATRVLTEDIAPCRNAQYSVSVSIDDFMTDTSGQAYLIGHWWILQKAQEKPVQPGHSFSLTERIDKAGGTESVTAMSALLGRLAGEIIRELPQYESVVPARPPA